MPPPPKGARSKGLEGFTLAEVLITLMILGIIASMVLPTIIPKIQDKLYARSASIFNRRLGEALKVMNLHDTLSGYSNTEDFVKELGKNLRIDKTCSIDNISGCFVSEFITDKEKTKKASDLTTSKKLNSSDDYGNTEVIGVRFTNGVSALIAYNKYAKTDQYNNDFIGLSSDNEGKDIRSGNVSLSTSALAILYDTNGDAGPNRMGKDIVGINVNMGGCTGTLRTIDGANWCDLGTSYEPYGTYYRNAKFPNADNYWAGAKKACVDMGGTLPDINTLRSLHGKSGAPTSGWYWSSSAYGSSLVLASGCYLSGSNYSTTGRSKSYKESVICQGDF